MGYIPKRVLYDEFPEEGVCGVTARQALEAAIDNLLPAYHLIFSPVTLHEYTRGAPYPLTKDFKKWHGLTVRVPLGVLYTLNFYSEHCFIDHDGKPSGVLIAGPLGMPGMRPEVQQCNEYLLWPEGAPVTFERARLFFLRDDLEDLAQHMNRQPSDGQSSESDAALGAVIRQRLQMFAARQREAQSAREIEYERWRKAANEIQQSRQNPASKRQLAGLVKSNLNLPDGVETIRKKL